MPYIIAFLFYVFSVQSGGITTQTDAVSLHQYAMDCCGYLGFVAHEEKAGAAFYELKEGDIITLTYPDEVRRYKVTDTKIMIAIIQDNANLSADIPIYWDETGSALSGRQLFHATYGENDLTLQTCYNGLVGRLFVVAERILDKQGRR
jgi:hypothetical protein